MVYEIKCPFCDEINEWDGNDILYCENCAEFLADERREGKYEIL